MQLSNPLHHFGLRCLAIISLLAPVLAPAQEPTPPYYQSLQWRCIGPFRAGRTIGATGVPSQPNVFYIGVNNGGAWKTTDYGRTWVPIFDSQPTGSVGDLAVAPSNPDIIYLGSGEGVQRPDLSTGDGVYKSTDGGKTWLNTGLRDAQQIGSVIVDPHDPNRVFVAALGHPYGPNNERGVYRTLDGGAKWQKVFYQGDDTGAIQVEFDPTNSSIIYAVLWESRQGPWENGAWQGTNSGLYKSTDGGTRWELLSDGLPLAQQGLGRIGIGISRSNPRILYATVEATFGGGIYRSDDWGKGWQLVNSDPRTFGRGSDFAEIKVDPKNPDIVYVANVTSLKSIDGGRTFKAFKGAPGGDDYHRIWINPDNPNTILFASDQGATITVNGGQTWSSWYNQPTAQFYHVITDNRFPYWVYGGQQESGSIAIASRGDYGAITWSDWRTVGVEEYGYVAPDPLDPNIIYGGKITRYDWRTGQSQNVAPDAIRENRHRFLRTAPVIFSPVDPHVLFFAGNVLFKTRNGGSSWETISPDLTREQPEVPESVGIYRTPEMARMPRRAVIYAVAPSYKDVNVIWAGTDDGLIHLTRNGGKTWTNVTPPGLTAWSKVSLIDAGRFDAQTAYVAVNRFRLDDLKPHIYRTHDSGQTWKEITAGITDNDVVNAVREDPERPGLLFAGTERMVYVSFNDGERWHPLRMNMPATSIRDLVVKGDDLVVGTHGRSFWILDDITPLRQLTREILNTNSFLFKPQVAWRLRRSVNTDTPIPPEEPMGQNPPDGAIIDYYLKADAKDVRLDIIDKSWRVVRSYTNRDRPEQIDESQLPYPSYWIRTPRVLPATPGMHRFVWDLHYPPPDGQSKSFPISAIYRDTPPDPLGPTALPGEYTVQLAVDDDVSSAKFILKMDPRVVTPASGIAKMFDVSITSYYNAQEAHRLVAEIGRLRAQLRERRTSAGTGALADAIGALDEKAAALAGTGGGGRRGRRGRGAAGEPTFSRLEGEFYGMMYLVEGADATPTTQAIEGFKTLQKEFAGLEARCSEVWDRDIPALNKQLEAAKLPVVDAIEQARRQGLHW